MKALPTPVRSYDIMEHYGKIIFTEWFKMPSGEEEDYLLMRTEEGMHSCMILPVTDDGHVVVQEEFRHAANRLILEIPGGCAEPGETPDEAILRELREESGYEPNELVSLGIHMPDPNFLRVEHHLYLGLGCRKVAEIERDTSDFIETRLYKVEDWIQMCLNGRIIDGKSVTATMRSLPHLGYSLTEIA